MIVSSGRIMTEKEKTNSKSLFNTCFPCCYTTPIDCDELRCPGFGNDMSDFEYIIENGALVKAPTKLLNESESKERKNDFSGYVVKNIPPEILIGPVIETQDACLEITSSDNLSESARKAYELNQGVAPIRLISENTPSKKPDIFETFHAQTKHMLDHNVIKELLIPHSTFYQNEQTQQQKVSADTHKSSADETLAKGEPVIPPEIKETIEALKVARPLHISSKFSPRNRRSLIRSSSATSCEKETCNFSDEKNDVKEDIQKKSPRTKRRYIPPDKIDATSSTSDFPDTARNTNTSSNLQSFDKSEITDSIEGQSLKWKIIINKHKEDNIS